MDDWRFLLPVGWLAFLIVIGYVVKSHERKLWNGGICKENGLAWESFDMASDGSIGYTTRARIGSDEGHHTIWLSWNFENE